MSRVVVITGGGTGIGAACARLMAAAGETPAKAPATPIGQPTEAQKASEILRRMQEKKL